MFSDKNMNRVETESIRHLDVKPGSRPKVKGYGSCVPGFEYLDDFPATFHDSESGESLDILLTLSVAPPNYGIHFSRSTVERAGVVAGVRIDYGFDKLCSAQAAVTRLQLYVRYGHNNASPQQMKLGDDLFGVTHKKSIPQTVNMSEKNPEFKKFLDEIVQEAIIQQFSLGSDQQASRDYSSRAWRSTLKKLAREVKFDSHKTVMVEKKEQNHSENPEPRKPKEKGAGSHSRGKEERVVQDYKGKFNITSQNLGLDFPMYDYYREKQQIILIFNEDNHLVKSILDDNSGSSSYADKNSASVEALALEAARWAVNREKEILSQEEWDSFIKSYELLSNEDSSLDVDRLKKAI